LPDRPQLRRDVKTPTNASLCDRCVEELDVDGAGVSIMSGRNSGPICSSSAQVVQLEDLQFSLGEGPCQDAFHTGQMVSEPDLASSSINRWPNYRPAALDLGACAVFAFPLQITAGVIGVLTLYNDTPGALTPSQTADARAIAQHLPDVMSLTGAPGDGRAHRSEAHQASGMLAVQLGISVDDALVRIRAHAYAENRSLAYVAGEILTHRLLLGNDGNNETERTHD